MVAHSDRSDAARRACEGWRDPGWWSGAAVPHGGRPGDSWWRGPWWSGDGGHEWRGEAWAPGLGAGRAGRGRIGGEAEEGWRWATLTGQRRSVAMLLQKGDWTQATAAQHAWLAENISSSIHDKRNAGKLAVAIETEIAAMGKSVGFSKDMVLDNLKNTSDEQQIIADAVLKHLFGMSRWLVVEH
ncbi:MAG: hypothetical protein LUO93_03030 [Methanomicrobiales archaeon]|nr:hypothetical protein [Methanomicrobiales archaeon]